MSTKLRIADLILLPFMYPAAWMLKTVRKIGVHRLPFCKRALLNVGVFPIRNHYYEPQFDHREAEVDATKARHLPGIEWHTEEQRARLKAFAFTDELRRLPLERSSEERPSTQGFYFNNGSFGPGDADYWYQLIRTVKPKRIIEIGSGNSTLLAIRAIEQNRGDDPAYTCEHTCIEPYEMPWLEDAGGVTVVRSKVEDVDLSFFSRLQENDILFIDSSHIIRPGGDVLFEYLELLPTLNEGVIVHVHDIFSPKDYPADWVHEKVLFWNEQYLLEAFLTHNDSWKVIGAINHLHHTHFDELKAIAPYLSPEMEPGSFYIQKIAP